MFRIKLKEVRNKDRKSHLLKKNVLIIINQSKILILERQLLAKFKPTPY